MKNIFDINVTNQLIDRINQLSSDTQPKWGKMSADQMLAHCNIAYDMTFTDQYPRPNAFKRFFIKKYAKDIVVSDKPYEKNSRTAPQFIIEGNRNFEGEKNQLIQYLQKVQELGESYFDGKESHSLGKLTAQEWNNMFYKHLDHHLTQFGV